MVFLCLLLICLLLAYFTRTGILYQKLGNSELCHRGRILVYLLLGYNVFTVVGGSEEIWISATIISDKGT